MVNILEQSRLSKYLMVPAMIRSLGWARPLCFLAIGALVPPNYVVPTPYAIKIVVLRCRSLVSMDLLM